MTARRVLPGVAVAAAVIAIGLAIAAFVRRPSAAATHRDAWAKAYAAARGCLIGAPPASEDAREALTAADLASPNRTCGPELVALAALGGDDGGGRWTELRLALGRLADAFIGRDPRSLTAGYDEALVMAAAERLAQSLTMFDSAVAAVRPDVAPVAAARPALEPLTLVPLEVNGAPAKFGSLWRGVMWVTTTDETYHQVRWNAGRPLVLATDGSTVSTWSPAGTWQAWIDADHRTTVMAATDTGTDRHTVAVARGAAQVLAVLGEDHRRLVVYRDSVGGWLGRSVDNGRTWSTVRLPFGEVQVSAAVAPSGNAVELAWTEDTTRRLVLDLDASTGPVPADSLIGTAGLWNDCSNGALWLVLHEDDTEHYAVRRADTSRDLLDLQENPAIEACSADAALVTIGTRQLFCTATTCKPVTSPGLFATAAVTGDTLVRAIEDDDVLGVWRGTAAPVFYKLAAHRTFHGAIDSGDRVVLIFGRDDQALEYAALEP